MTATSRDTQLLTAMIWAMEVGDITQKEVAEEANLKQPTISRWQREVVEVVQLLREGVTPLQKGSRKAVRGWLTSRSVLVPVPDSELPALREWADREYRKVQGRGVAVLPALSAGSATDERLADATGRVRTAMEPTKGKGKKKGRTGSG